ncbi:MAG TPA: DUF92 domain-containing protein [Bacteroidota bacterium]|nr:DUF92 domain-containing protein [Bacteroidota bacterium]
MLSAIPGSQYLIGLCFGFVIAALAYKRRWLTVGGASATLIFAIVIFGMGGWKWTVPIVTFFVTSSALTRAGRERKAGLKDAILKPGPRDAMQVLANGGVSLLLVILHGIFRDVNLYLPYAGSIAAATADTWATEVGMLSRNPPLLVRNLRRAEPGTSGAVSLMGLAAGLIGSCVVGLSALPWLDTITTAGAIIVSGIAACVFDTLLGSTVQAEYECPGCGRRSEKRIHCGRIEGRRVRGFTWVDNDVVNFACTSSGALLMSLFAAK